MIKKSIQNDIWPKIFDGIAWRATYSRPNQEREIEIFGICREEAYGGDYLKNYSMVDQEAQELEGV